MVGMSLLPFGAADVLSLSRDRSLSPDNCRTSRPDARERQLGCGAVHKKVSSLAVGLEAHPDDAANDHGHQRRGICPHPIPGPAIIARITAMELLLTNRRTQHGGPLCVRP